MRPMVSIIVVTWNGRDLLGSCLESLCRQRYADREIVLVDNGSVDGSAQFVLDEFPEVRIVVLAENRGFTGGATAGLEACSGEFIALLNDDAQADEHWLGNLLHAMHGDPRIGICASKILRADNGTIDSAGDGLTTWGVGYKRGLGKDVSCYSSQGYVFGACGAAALYRRTMLEEIGFLDELLFMHYEDTDLNFRAQLAGWKCLYVPMAIVYHKVSGTVPALSEEHVYYHARNLEAVWIKDMPVALMLRFAHHKLFQEIASFLYLCLMRRQWKAYLKAKRDAVKLLPSQLRRRREIQKRRTVSNSYLQSMLTPLFNRELIQQKTRQWRGRPENPQPGDRAVRTG